MNESDKIVRLAEVLDRCIELLLSGEENMEGCLARYPEFKEELEPLLRTAAFVRAVPLPTPSSTFRITARQRLLKTAEARGRNRMAFVERVTGIKDILMRVAAVILIVILVGSGAVAASARSLPDSPLYPLKIAMERVQLVFAFDDYSKAQLHLKFAKNRLNEIMLLVAQGKEEGLNTALSEMNNEVEKVQAMVETIPANKKMEILRKVIELTEYQGQVLQTVWTKVPDPAKGAIQRAVEVSRRGHEQAESALKKKERIITPPKPKVPRAPKVPDKSRMREETESTPSISPQESEHPQEREEGEYERDSRE